MVALLGRTMELLVHVDTVVGEVPVHPTQSSELLAMLLFEISDLLLVESRQLTVLPIVRVGAAPFLS